MPSHFNRVALAVALLGLAALVWWLPNALTPRGELFEGEKRHEPDYIIENFTATVMDPHGHRKHELRAHRLEHFPDDDTVTLDRPYLVQYKPDGPPLHTRADRGFTTTTSKEIVMRGNVRVTRSARAGSPAGEVTAQEMRVLLE
jgi:lipopolysaccharide export system protein LptC